MIVKLRVLRGRLRNRNGAHAGSEIEIRRRPFVVGTATDCQMCCRSSTVSSHHCELDINGEGLLVKDLDSASGTFVNDVRIEERTRLEIGDRLRIGRIEFEIVVDANEGSQPDSMSELVSEMLDEADAEDRARRLEDPQLRLFDASTIETSEVLPSEPTVDETAAQKPVRPKKKPPGKLPVPPEYVADDTVQAAQETLEKLFERKKKRQR